MFVGVSGGGYRSTVVRLYVSRKECVCVVCVRPCVCVRETAKKRERRVYVHVCVYESLPATDQKIDKSSVTNIIDHVTLILNVLQRALNQRSSGYQVEDTTSADSAIGNTVYGMLYLWCGE